MKKNFDITNDKDGRLKILLSIHSTMVLYSQEVRGSVERLTVWGCGLILLLDGWLVTTAVSITDSGRVAISIGIVAFTLIVTFIIRSLHQRFTGFAYVIRRLNQVEGVYERGVFLKDETLYPEQWKNFGSKEWKEPIFRIAYISLTFVGIFGVIIAWIF